MDTPVKHRANSSFHVALVEDQDEICKSWSRIINSFADFKCVCTCSSGEEALQLVPAARPDAVLMDIRLPGMSGIECTAKLKELLPRTPVIILTALDDDKLIFCALEAGADGYLLKRTKPADLRSALIDVLEGGAPMTSAIARRVVRSFRKTSGDQHGTASLSPREVEVLELLSRGLSNKEIAEQLQLSVETVRSYLKNVYEKLHVRSRTEAAMQYTSSKHPNSL
jgi:DNA-binding NarL/FixJ family response regulator